MAILRYCHIRIPILSGKSPLVQFCGYLIIMLCMTKKLDPSVATADKNRIVLSEFREQVLMFHQNPYEPVDPRIHATKSGFEMIRYLKKESKRCCLKISTKDSQTKNLKKSKFPTAQKGQHFKPYRITYIHIYFANQI